jgi:hypothetical protein
MDDQTDTRDKFPSLSIPRNRPFGWIQWKGTRVCMDIHCDCGEMTHFDGEFCYHVKCAICGRIYECDGHIALHHLAFEPEGTQETEIH